MVTSAFRRSRSSVWRYASRMSWDTGWKAVWATSKSKSSKPKSVPGLGMSTILGMSMDFSTHSSTAFCTVAFTAPPNSSPPVPAGSRAQCCSLSDLSVGQTIVLCRLPTVPEGGRPQSAMVCPTKVNSIVARGGDLLHLLHDLPKHLRLVQVGVITVNWLCGG